MSEEERAEMAQKFAGMTNDEYAQYMEEEQQHQQEQQQHQQEQQQNQKQQYEQNAAASYIAFNSGYGRKLYSGFQDPDAVCQTCEQSCEDGHMNGDDEDYYKGLEEMFKEGLCTQVSDNLYAGPTCGSNGQTIELGLFSDQYCTTMSQDSAYSYIDNINMGDGYMAVLQNLYTMPFSCTMGLAFDYKAAYENVSVIFSI